MKKNPQHERYRRARFFLAVEGESEQSFIKWLDILANQNGLHIHLDCKNLGGGGYESMLEQCKKYKAIGSKAKQSILIVDTDRALRGDDGWSLERLKREAAKNKIEVCFQKPKFEGLLLRLFAGYEQRLELSATEANHQLLKLWPNYVKPEDAISLTKKFSLSDLFRAAQFDFELKRL